MKRTVSITLAAIFVAALAPTHVLAGDPGQDLFLSSKCNKCHVISSKGIEKAKPEGGDDGDKDDGGGKKPFDLSGVGADHDAAWITKWLKKEVEKDKGGKMIKHKKTWKGTDAELKSVVDFLSTLKTPTKN